MVLGGGVEPCPPDGAAEPDRGAEQGPFVRLAVRGGAGPVRQGSACVVFAGIEPVVQQDGAGACLSALLRNPEARVLGLAPRPLVEGNPAGSSGREGLLEHQQFFAVQGGADG